MYICTFKYTPEDVECKYCLHYEKRNCTVETGCPYIAERIEAGAVNYEEVINDTFKSPATILRWRLRYLIETFGPTMWESELHKKRFRYIWLEHGANKKRDTPLYFAALYLLTSNDEVYRRAYNAFLPDGIKTEYIRMCGISVPNYAVVQAAKSIYNSTNRFIISDLEDSEAVITPAFRCIVNALLVARYGRDVLKIKEVSQ